MDEQMNVSAPASAPAEPVSTPAPAPAEPSNSTPNTNPSPQADRSSEPHFRSTDGGEQREVVSAGGMRVVKDEFGRRKIEFVKQDAGEPPEAVEHINPPPIGQAENGQSFASEVSQSASMAVQQPPQYNLNEFSQAIATGNIDERRVPPEFQERYQQFRIDQAVRDFNNRMAEQERIRQQQVQQVEQQLTPEEQAHNMQVFYSELDKEANERAIKDAGLTEEDVENLQYMEDNDPKLVNYRLAKDWHKNQIMQSLQNRAAEEQRAREAQQRTFNDIKNFVDNARVTEPNFNEIDVIMKDRYRSLPYETNDPNQLSGRKVAEVISALQSGNISPQQALVLQRYYESCRLEFYAKRNGLQTTPQKVVARPPVVENAGDGRSEDNSYVPDFGKLRNSDVRGRREWVAEYLKNRNR